MEEATESGPALSDDVAHALKERAASVPDGALLLLPVRVADEKGQYRDRDLTLPKELRALDVPANFLHTPEERTALTELSADVIYAIALGVIANMTWDAAKQVVQYLYARAETLARRDATPMLRLDVARIRRDDLEIDDLSLTAPATPESAEAFIRLLVGDTPKSGDEPGEPSDA